MFEQAPTVPMPGAACPPADDPDGILVWLYGQHLRAGRIEPHTAHRDPFWRRVADKRRERQRLAAEIASDADLSARLVQLAVLLEVPVDGLSHDEQVAAVVRASAPLRFLLSAELENLGHDARGAEVLRSRY